MIELNDEINHVKSYVEIEKARFEEKLTVIYNIDEKIRFLIPPLTLQPIVENAIKHGILAKKNGGKVIISIFEEKESIKISVFDNGVGVDEETIDELLDLHSNQSNSIGLNNVFKRLNYIFGEKVTLKIDSEIGHWTEVIMKLPKIS